MTRRALLVGIGGYRTMPPLRAPVNDVLDVASFLVARESFSFRDITVLTDQDATRARILQEVGALMTRTSERDVALLYFTGHGLQVADESGDESDRLDEAMVTYSEEVREVVTDDDLYPLLAGVHAGAALYSIFDYCHSGIDEPQVLPRETAAPHLLMAAALPQQSAWQMGSDASIRRHGYEWWEDGNYHSTFTYYLLKLLRMFPEGLACGRLLEKINLYLRIHDYEQQGTILGSPELMERPFLRPW